MSRAEREVALMLCKGYIDKEVANRLCRSYHTVRTQKKAIYAKLGVSKDTELLAYMICERLDKDFDLREFRELGIEYLTQ